MKTLQSIKCSVGKEINSDDTISMDIPRITSVIIALAVVVNHIQSVSALKATQLQSERESIQLLIPLPFT
jgi:hypothetical protein